MRIALRKSGQQFGENFFSSSTNSAPTVVQNFLHAMTPSKVSNEAIWGGYKAKQKVTIISILVIVTKSGVVCMQMKVAAAAFPLGDGVRERASELLSGIPPEDHFPLPSLTPSPSFPKKRERERERAGSPRERLVYRAMKLRFGWIGSAESRIDH